MSVGVIPAHVTLRSHSDFAIVYRKLIWEILFGGAEEVNERTGARILMLRHPAHFNIALADRRLPVIGIRRTYPKTAAAEVAWFLSGERDATFIREYAPIWDKFLEEDGTVAGAYGYRWRRHFGRDQVQDAIEALRANPTDRRVLISAWDPGQDGLGRPSKNVPCPAMYTLSIVNGRLNSALFIRSSDVFVGLPYDVMGHAMLMACFAASLGVELGHMSVTLAHPHLYGVHEQMAVDAINSEGQSTDTCEMPGGWTVAAVVLAPDVFVEEYGARWYDPAIRKPTFRCKPELVV